MMRMWWLALVMLIAAATPAEAADCDLRASSAAQHQTYDPFAPPRTVVDLTVTVRNDGKKPCGASVYLAPIDGVLALTSNGNALTYQVENGNSARGNASEYGPFNVNVPGGMSRNVAIRLVLPAQQIVPRGAYSGQFTIRAVSDDGTDIPVTGAGTLVSVDVPARVEVSISGASHSPFPSSSAAPAMMNFGVAQPGKTERVYVGVWSNGSVSVSIQSSNQGVMRHVERPSLPGLTYSARFDGTALQPNGSAMLQRTPPMSLAGASYELAVTLGPVDGLYAGQYRDVLTINVAQN